jgi:type II secretory pathway pseudopilin PulG
VNKNGFTLLEVTLFLAISSALALIVFVTLAPRLRNVRFTQAARALETSVDQSFLQSQSGGNGRGESVTCGVSGTTLALTTSGTTPVGSASECVKNGKIAAFEATKVTYRTIVSLTKPVSQTTCTNYSATGLAKLISSQCYRSRILTDAEEQPAVYTYPGSFKQTSQKKALGYIINPETSEKIYFSMDSTGNFYGNLRSTSFTINEIASTPNELCYAAGARTVKFAFNNQSLKPDLKFDEACS